MEQEHEASRRPLEVVVIGGGVAGMTAVEELLDLLPPSAHITLITSSSLLKQIGKAVRVTRVLQELEVVER
jgi:NADH dehydrogenase FAD-containing subunit